jgi:hypothetical protein
MYFMNPGTALDLARFRVDQDMARAEAHRIAREVKAARKAARPETPSARPRGRRTAAVRGAAALRLGH